MSDSESDYTDNPSEDESSSELKPLIRSTKGIDFDVRKLDFKPHRSGFVRRTDAFNPRHNSPRKYSLKSKFKKLSLFGKLKTMTPPASTSTSSPLHPNPNPSGIEVGNNGVKLNTIEKRLPFFYGNTHQYYSYINAHPDDKDTEYISASDFIHEIERTMGPACQNITDFHDRYYIIKGLIKEKGAAAEYRKLEIKHEDWELLKKEFIARFQTDEQFDRASEYLNIILDGRRKNETFALCTDRKRREYMILYFKKHFLTIRVN